MSSLILIGIDALALIYAIMYNDLILNSKYYGPSKLNQSLLHYNTFAVESFTKNLLAIKQDSDIQSLLQHHNFDAMNYLLLGAGSNLLLLDTVPEMVVAMRMVSISYKEESNGQVTVNAGAGVSWHDLVKDSLSKGFNGLENLALIPGLVGAAPIQNIGAYGVELADRFISLKATDLLTGKEREFLKDECQFDYRDSFFKHGEGQHYLITSVSLSLTTKPVINLDYRALKNAFSGETTVDARMVFNKVCEIRKSKLPDPAQLGNAGSFFKNPLVSDEKYQRLKQQFPDLIAYPQGDKLLPNSQQTNNNWKLAAGWMIDKAGLKGYRTGNVGVHVDQALVLVNFGGASGHDIVNLARFVQQKVEQMFSVKLEPEVTIIGKTGVTTLEDIN